MSSDSPDSSSLDILFVGAVMAWVGFDLYAPRHTDIRKFDPPEVARLETMMWRSYYERRRLRLFAQMAELLRQSWESLFKAVNE